MIEVQDLKKEFPDKKVLKGISTTFQAGKCNLIIGESGAGKTVFLKTMLGIFPPTSGKILFNNRDFITLTKKEQKDIRKEIGMVFQGGALFDSMNVQENILFPLKMFSKLSVKEQIDRVNFCLKRVNLEGVNNKLPAELSGGMQKRVAIARAIALNPKYLFCDEPNSGLDPKTAILIDDLLMEITEEYNMTTIVNTHDMNSVMQIGQQIIFIKNGFKSWEGNKDNLIKDMNDDLEDFVFSSELFRKIRDANR